MNCSQSRRLIELNPLSSLRTAELHDIRSHAETCPSCGEMLESVTGLEQELTALPEVDAPPELCGRVMDSISAGKPAPRAELETRRALFAYFLRNLSFVTATAALLIGIRETQWLGNLLSFDLAFDLGKTLAVPFSSTSVGLTALACLLALAGLALADGVTSRKLRPGRSRITV